MLQISQQQAIERYDSLPQVLKEALFSQESDELIWRIGEAHHLNDEKKSILTTIVGDVIMGFLHPDDLRRELQEVLGIDIRIAASISREVNKRIFYPIRDEIRKVYTPIITGFQKPPMPLVEEMPEEIPTKEKISEETKTPVEELKKPSFPPRRPFPTPPLVVPPIPPKPESGKPFILHKQEALKPVLETQMPAAGATGQKFSPFLQATPVQTPPKPAAAEIELGPKISDRAQEVKGAGETPRIVHYSGFRTPLQQPFETPQPKTEQQTIPPVPQPKVQQQTINDKQQEVKPTPPSPQSQIPTQPSLPPIQKQETKEQGKEIEEKVIDLSSFRVVGKENSGGEVIDLR